MCTSPHRSWCPPRAAVQPARFRRARQRHTSRRLRGRPSEIPGEQFFVPTASPCKDWSRVNVPYLPRRMRAGEPYNGLTFRVSSRDSAVRATGGIPMKLAATLAVCLVLVVATASCSNKPPAPPPQTVTPDIGGSANLVDFRNGLSNEDRQTFYHLSEGAEVIPLAVLQGLERARTPQDRPGEGLVAFT